jgi:hypothetical protein
MILCGCGGPNPYRYAGRGGFFGFGTCPHETQCPTKKPSRISAGGSGVCKAAWVAIQARANVAIKRLTIHYRGQSMTWVSPSTLVHFKDHSSIVPSSYVYLPWPREVGMPEPAIECVAPPVVEIVPPQRLLAGKTVICECCRQANCSANSTRIAVASARNACVLTRSASRWNNAHH